MPRPTIDYLNARPMEDEMTKRPHNLPLVEECIAWAAQQGFCFAQTAAEQYSSVFVDREMVKDDNTAMYNTRTWQDRTPQ